MAGVAELSDVALLYRLQGAQEWLGTVLAALLQRAAPPPAGVGRPVQLVDATSLGGPGRPKKVAWRVHARFDLATATLSGLELTRGTESESLARFAPTPGAIVIADRHYAKAKGLERALAGGADVIVRYGLTGCALRDPAGRRVTLAAILAQGGLADREDRPVVLAQGDGTARPARLVLIRQPAASAARARERARRKARQQGQAASARRLAAAEWLALLTTLDAERYPPEQVAALYRFRWQIELLLERLKSQLGLGDAQAKGPRLARATLLAKLILAALTAQALGQALALSPSRPPPPTLALAADPPGAAGPARGAARPMPPGGLAGKARPPRARAARAATTAPFAAG